MPPEMAAMLDTNPGSQATAAQTSFEAAEEENEDINPGSQATAAQTFPEAAGTGNGDQDEQGDAPGGKVPQQWKRDHPPAAEHQSLRISPSPRGSWL